jgi:AcrR family transcriptional regulator
MAKDEQPALDKRRRGRPKLEIDLDAVADAVAELFAEGGIDAVSIQDAADRLAVSRATLYRSVASKEALLGLLFERSTGELMAEAQRIMKAVTDPGERLVQLVRIQTFAAVRMRRYMPVFFGGGDLPEDVVTRWHGWSRDYEAIWVSVVKANIAAGLLEDTDPVLTARLILGSCIWVSRWYRPAEGHSAEHIADTAAALVRALHLRQAPRPTD